MPLYLLDTNIISDLMYDPRQGRAAKRVRLVAETDLVTSAVVLGELQFGVERKGSEKLRARMYAIVNTVEVLPLTERCSEHYGKLRTDLERKGTMISPNDLWIASHALAAHCVLVTDNDSEFRRVPGLVVENWLRD
ncbi:MAG TPA: type II toxin-antitoxin system VapC family toxin [Polyangiales bacterium]|nr:type II toxin-antitoxin system VapC family toxin [Polyangiales bacterium]